MNEPFSTSSTVTVAFYAASVLTIVAAVLVVTQRDLVRSVVALAFSFIGVAAIYFILNAEFIGIVQILVYVGAISILIAFAVMFIRDLTIAGALSKNMLLSATASVLLLAAVIFVVYNTEWVGIEEVTHPDAVAGLVGEYTEHEQNGRRIVRIASSESEDSYTGVMVDSSGTIGALLIRNYLLPFETLGLLLIAALIGALVIIRERRGDAKN